MQVHTDVTIDRVMTLAAAKGDAGPALPNGSMLSSYFLYSRFHLLLISYQLQAPMIMCTKQPHMWIP
jgi:hypothetical protein